MGLTAFAIERRVFSYFATIVVFVAGIVAFLNLGQLEDPEFTIKAAVISTQYPGASSKEVELEVTDRIELAVQEMPEIKYIESLSRAGLSIIKVEIRPEFSTEKIPQIWDELRRKIRDIESRLPPGAGRPGERDVGRLGSPRFRTGSRHPRPHSRTRSTAAGQGRFGSLPSGAGREGFAASVILDLVRLRRRLGSHVA